MDGWMDEQHMWRMSKNEAGRMEVEVEVNGGLWFRMAAERVVISALKKHEKQPENPAPRDFSTRVYFLMKLYTL